MACRRALVVIACGCFNFALVSLVPQVKLKRTVAGRVSFAKGAENSSRPSESTVSVATGDDDWKNGRMDMGSNISVVKSGNLTVESNRAALLIIGHVRSLVWDIVCENIKTRLVDALAKPREEPGVPPGTAWKVDVFLFLSLVDSDSRKIRSRLKQAHREEMLKKCIQKLEPMHVEFMPPTYQPPKDRGAKTCFLYTKRYMGKSGP